MSNQKVYGPWIKWHGGECPVPPGTMVEVRYRSGVFGLAAYANCWWRHDGDSADIVEYRSPLEQSDLEAAEKLLLANDYTVTPPTKPLTFEDVTPMTEAPPEGARYWVISAAERDGAYSVLFGNDEYDQSVIKRRMAYLEKEHALIAAKHIFGLKGGEL